MAITREQVRGVADLARLHLTPEEVERLTADLGHILDAFARLSTLDTEGVDPTAHVDDADAILRPDETTNPVASEGLLAGAPARDGRFFRVPRILE